MAPNKYVKGAAADEVYATSPRMHQLSRLYKSTMFYSRAGCTTTAILTSIAHIVSHLFKEKRVTCFDSSTIPGAPPFFVELQSCKYNVYLQGDLLQVMFANAFLYNRVPPELSNKSSSCRGIGRKRRAEWEMNTRGSRFEEHEDDDEEHEEENNNNHSDRGGGGGGGGPTIEEIVEEGAIRDRVVNALVPVRYDDARLVTLESLKADNALRFSSRSSPENCKRAHIPDSYTLFHFALYVALKIVVQLGTLDKTHPNFTTDISDREVYKSWENLVASFTYLDRDEFKKAAFESTRHPKRSTEPEDVDF